MRILIATGLYPPEVGGPATYTKLLEERLPSHGIEVEVLPFRAVRHLPPGVRHLVYFGKCFFRARKADIIYGQDTVSVGFPAALAAKLAGKKFLVRVPGDYAWEQARQRFGVGDDIDTFQKKKYGWRVELLRSMQRFVVNRASRVVVPSEYMKEIVWGWIKNPPRRTIPSADLPSDFRFGNNAQGRVVTIYSSVEPPAIEEVKWPEGFLVVSSGRRVPWKHFDAIERAVAREPAWRFKLIENMPRAQALGWVKAADVFVLNSTYEGLSHALVEAMMLGTPVVATNVGGNPELIENGMTGLLIEPKNDDALYAALKKVESDPDAARSRAQHARERAQEFSIGRTIEKLVALLQSI